MADESNSDSQPSASEDRPERFVVGTLEQVKALTHPLRQRILERFADKTQTTKQVADELGEKPTRLYHHVATLERAGLIRLVETRPKRGTTEKYYTAVAGRFEIDPRTFAGDGDKMTAGHPTVAILEGFLDETRAELGDLIRRETIETLAEQAFFIRGEVRGDRQFIDLARKRIEALIDELREEAPDEVEEEEVQRLFLGWYPLRS